MRTVPDRGSLRLKNPAHQSRTGRERSALGTARGREVQNTHHHAAVLTLMSQVMVQLTTLQQLEE